MTTTQLFPQQAPSLFTRSHSHFLPPTIPMYPESPHSPPLIPSHPPQTPSPHPPQTAPQNTPRSGPPCSPHSQSSKGSSARPSRAQRSSARRARPSPSAHMQYSRSLRATAALCRAGLCVGSRASSTLRVRRRWEWACARAWIRTVRRRWCACSGAQWGSRRGGVGSRAGHGEGRRLPVGVERVRRHTLFRRLGCLFRCKAGPRLYTQTIGKDSGRYQETPMLQLLADMDS